MKNSKYIPKIIFTSRLILIPFTIKICTDVLDNNFKIIEDLGLKRGKNWPDTETLETLPKIISNLSKVFLPTGFESWMIIKKDTNEIIGDIGFKGLNKLNNNCDLGYGIVKSERRKGYAEEAAKSLINWVLNNDSSITITASTLIDNEESIRLLQKLNFIEVIRDENLIYWKLLNEDFSKNTWGLSWLKYQFLKTRKRHFFSMLRICNPWHDKQKSSDFVLAVLDLQSIAKNLLSIKNQLVILRTY